MRDAKLFENRKPAKCPFFSNGILAGRQRPASHGFFGVYSYRKQAVETISSTRCCSYSILAHYRCTGFF